MKTSLKFSVLFHLLVILAFVTAKPLAYLILGIAIVYAILKNIRVFSGLNSKEKLPMMVYFFVILLGAMVNVFTEPIVIYHLFICILTLLTAVIFTRDPNVYYYSSKVTLIAFQCVAILYVCFKGLNNFPIEVPFENMIEGSSANGITSYMVLLQLNFLLISFFLFRKVTFFTAILTLIIALLGYGRGSIIAAFLILLICLFTYFALKSKIKFFSYMLLSVFLTLLVSAYYFNEIYLFLDANTKLSAGIVDVSRAQIIDEYTSKINFLTFLTGADYEGTSVITQFNGNPHNSFIRAHHIFGILYLFFIVAFPFYAIFQRKGVLEILFYSAIVVILFFRSFSEPIIFPTLFDFYFFSMFLFLLRNKPELSPAVN